MRFFFSPFQFVIFYSCFSNEYGAYVECIEFGCRKRECSEHQQVQCKKYCAKMNDEERKFESVFFFLTERFVSFSFFFFLVWEYRIRARDKYHFLSVLPSHYVRFTPWINSDIVKIKKIKKSLTEWMFNVLNEYSRKFEQFSWKIRCF